MTSKQSFALLCVVGLFAFISYNLIRMPLLPLFARSLGAKPEMIGFIVSASTLTGVLLKWPAGALADIYDRRWLLLVGLLAFALPPFGYLFVEDVRWLIGLRFLHGLATAIFGPIAMTVVADLFKGTRGVALGSYTAATQGGAMLGPLLGGWLMTMSGFRWAFAAAGLAGCMAFLLFLVIRWPPQARHAAAGAGTAAVLGDMAKGARTVINNFRVMVTSATDGARQLANGALMAFLPIYVVSLGMDAAQAGILFGVQSITSFVSRPTMGWASDRIGRRPLIVLGLITCALVIAAIPYARAFSGLLLLCALFGFGEAIVNASAAALVADLSELKTLGSAMGMQGAIMDIGHALGPMLAGLLVGGMGFQSAFLILGGVVLVAAAGFWLAVTHETAVH